MPKQPQDRKPKQEPGAYTFRHDGKTYRLPSGETAVSKIPGRFLRDAYMDGDEGEMRLGFAMLEHVDATPGAIDALYSMPAPEMLDHVRAWMTFKPSEEDASLGESSSSPE